MDRVQEEIAGEGKRIDGVPIPGTPQPSAYIHVALLVHVHRVEIHIACVWVAFIVWLPAHDGVYQRPHGHQVPVAVYLQKGRRRPHVISVLIAVAVAQIVAAVGVVVQLDIGVMTRLPQQ